MSDVSVAFAKFAGIQKAMQALLDETTRRGLRPIGNFAPSEVEPYFMGAVEQLQILRENLPDLFGDFSPIQSEPNVPMSEGAKEPIHFGRRQLEALRRTIDQIFEIRANSELAVPASDSPSPRVFISHGRASDWHQVQPYIERDIGIPTLELAQEPNLGRTVLQKPEQEAQRCTSAVIVMTGEDFDADGNLRARENVLHEIGFFQGKFGLSAVCMLHEEGTNIPSNIYGLVDIRFPKGCVEATFGVLTRELKRFYGL